MPSHRNEKCESYAETGKAAVSEDNLKQALMQRDGTAADVGELRPQVSKVKLECRRLRVDMSDLSDAAQRGIKQPDGHGAAAGPRKHLR